MPAVDLPGADGRADARAFTKTFIEADAGAFTGTDARTDDGDARADASTIRKSDARALTETDDGGALFEAHASALLVGPLLERRAYGCYRLWCLKWSSINPGGALGSLVE